MQKFEKKNNNLQSNTIVKRRSFCNYTTEGNYFPIKVQNTKDKLEEIIFQLAFK